MKKPLQVVLDVFRFHKKKILFFFAAIAFWFVTLFPYDDLSDYLTLLVTQQTQSNVYLQFDGLSFGLMPQLGIKMDNVLVESVYAPTLSMKTLGFAPKMSLLFGSTAGKLKAYGLFGGDATIDLSSSSELDVNNEMGVEINLEDVALKDLSKFLKKSFDFPVSMSGQTQVDSLLHIDPTFKKQPKGSVEIKIKDLDIPSSNISIGPANMKMSMAFPALKLTNLVIEGNINDGKLFIKEGQIGDPKNDLHGKVTGDIFFEVQRGGRLKMGGYDLKINLNVSENLKRQLGTVLGFVDIYQGIGDKYKFDSLRGVRYSMRLTARSMQTPPRVSAF